MTIRIVFTHAAHRSTAVLIDALGIGKGGGGHSLSTHFFRLDIAFGKYNALNSVMGVSFFSPFVQRIIALW